MLKELVEKAMGEKLDIDDAYEYNEDEEFDENLEANEGEEEEEDEEEEENEEKEKEKNNNEVVPMEIDLEKNNEDEPKTPTRTRDRSKRRALPPQVLKLLGQANMYYISGEFEKAIEILKEVIRTRPTIPTPYQTLGVIYEALNEPSRALQFYLIAANLKPKDIDMWKRVAQAAREQGEYTYALYCLKRVCKQAPDDADALSDIALLHATMEHHSRAIDAYLSLMKLRKDDLCLWLLLAESYHADGQVDKAIETLNSCIEISITDNPQEEIVLNASNMLADLYLSKDQYKEAKDVIHNCHSFLSKVQNRPNSNPVSLPLDLAIKYGICHIYLLDLSTAKSMFNHLFQQNTEEFGDLYLDIASAYMKKEFYQLALETLEKLFPYNSYQNQILWSKVGICKGSLNQYNEALEYILKALEDQRESNIHAVDHELTLMGLCCYNTLKRYDEVPGFIARFAPSLTCLITNESIYKEQIIEQHIDYEAQTHLVLSLGEIVRSQGNLSKYCQLIVPAILSYTTDYMQHAELKLKKSLVWDTAMYEYKEAFHLNDNQELILLNLNVQMMSIISEQDFELLVSNSLNWLYNSQHFSLTKALVHLLLMSGVIGSPSIKIDLFLDFFLAALKHKENLSAYNHIRYFFSEEEYGVGGIHCLNRALINCGQYRSLQKYLVRFMQAHTTNADILVLIGNTSRQNEAISLRSYLMAYQIRPSEPLLPLLVALEYLGISQHRKLLDRNLTISRAFAFLNTYMELRQKTASNFWLSKEERNKEKLELAEKTAKHEAYYNLARAYHQLGLTHIAIPLYEQSLKESESVKELLSDAYNLSHEIAVNLSIAYRMSGSNELARYVLKKYNTLD